MVFEEKTIDSELLYNGKILILKKDILELKMNGFTNVEISKLLGINYRGIQSKLRKIKKKLKNNVQNDYN